MPCSTWGRDMAEADNDTKDLLSWSGAVAIDFAYHFCARAFLREFGWSREHIIDYAKQVTKALMDQRYHWSLSRSVALMHFGDSLID